jgi:deoxyribodipyrimidine photolyase-related protein
MPRQTGVMSDAPLSVFADQLGPHVHGGHPGREVVLVESARVLRSRPFHRQKLHLVLSGMQHLAAELSDRALPAHRDRPRGP